MILGGIVPDMSDSTWKRISSLDIQCIAEFMIRFRDMVARNIAEKLEEKHKLLDDMNMASPFGFISVKNPINPSVLYHFLAAAYQKIELTNKHINLLPYLATAASQAHRQFSCVFLDVDIFLYCPIILQWFEQEPDGYIAARRLVDDYHRRIWKRKDGYVCTHKLTEDIERVVDVMRSGQ